MLNIKKILSFSILFVFLFTLSACQPKTKPSVPETEEFYINDNANTLLNATKWTIFNYSLELYEDSLHEDYENTMIAGSQVVVLTYVGSVGDINTTELFNAWGIGKNNMGILIVLFFQQQSSELIYTELVFEIGTKMSEYLSAFEASGLVDQYFNDSSIPSTDYDLRLISLYFGVMQFIYLNVYDYTSFNYQSFIDEYIDNQYEYFGPLPSEETNIFTFVPIWVWIIVIVAFILFGGNRWFFPLLFFGGRGGSRFRGGGGKSIGYWFRK
jgi:hypothetical protein